MRIGVTILLAAGLASCSDAPPTSPAIERHDSAGVEIVDVLELPALDSTRGWDVELVREIPGGGGTAAGDSIVLYNPGGAVRFADGRLVVLDKGPQRLVVFDAQNAVLARFAPPGRGPGEISGDGVVLIANADSTLTVVELWGNTRVHRLTLDGKLLEDHRIERISMTHGAATSDGERVVQVWTPAAPVYIDSLARLDIDSGSVDAFAALPARYATSGPAPLFYPLSMWSSFRAGHVLMGTTDSNVLSVQDSVGALLRVIRLPITPTPVTEESAAKVREVHASFLAATRTGDEPERFHSHHRLMSRLFTLNDTLFAMEHTWLTRPDEDALDEIDVRVWRVFDVGGRPAGIVRFAPGFTPWSIDDGHVLGVHEDSLGVPTFREYRLTSIFPADAA